MTAVDAMRRWWTQGDGRLPGSAECKVIQPVIPVPPRESSERPWLKRLDEAGIPRTLTYPTTTLARVLDQTADRFGDAPALSYHHERWNYRELLARVNRMAGGLASLGVRRGDRVLLTLPNCPEYVVSFFAIQKLGAMVVNAGPLIGADDLKTIIAMTQPRAAVGLDLQAKWLDRVARGSGLEQFVSVTLQAYQSVFKRLGYQFKLWHDREKSDGKARHTTLAHLLENAPSRPPTVLPEMTDTAVLQPTGGTTGSPKLAELTHQSLIANAMQVSLWMGNRYAQESILSVLPMFHVYGLTTCLLSGVFSASRLVLLTRFSAPETLETLRRGRPTVFPLVPAICNALSNALEKEEEPRPLDGLRLCISGAAPLPAAIAERFERLTGARVIEGYGLSEASPVTHANLPSKPLRGTIGLPMPDTNCKIVDADDPQHELAVGEEGELLISGPQVMKGYFANPAQTAIALSTDSDGRRWLHTGDIARVEPDGNFVILDRKKEMIIRSGMKVFPAKVEKVLMTHPRVKEAAVVGRADEAHTQAVVAFIATNDKEDNNELPTQLRALCREHLAPYEVPAEFRFIEALPRSPLGKVLKRELPIESPESSNGNENGKHRPGQNGNAVVAAKPLNGGN
jgi:long-chain acyl-CoA synthetase